MLRVLIADDSALVREALVSLIDEDPDMTVVGVASGGGETVKKAQEVRPDLITMDLLMPDMDGVEATRQIMAKNPVPIVMVSSTVSAGLESTHFDALAVGAVDVVEKPDVRLLRADSGLRRRFLENLKSMSSVVMVTRKAQHAERPPSSLEPRGSRMDPRPELRAAVPREAKVIVVGASTGGPPAVAEVLARLDPSMAPPVVVVQHMASGFIGGYADWLGHHLSMRVCLARNGEILSPGVVYIAPDDHHVEVGPFNRLSVYRGQPLRYNRPSVDVLFGSAASMVPGKAVGVLLTGMGDDGARGLSLMRQAGCLTIAQDEASSVVYGMPAAAVQRSAARLILDSKSISDTLSVIRASRHESGAPS